MKKKAQVAIFVIIAIVIVVGIATFFLLRENNLQPIISPEIEDINDAICYCTEVLTEHGSVAVGLGGGYVNSSNNYIDTEFGKIEYSILNQNNVLVRINTIEEERENYIESGIDNCFDESEFNNFQITKGNPSAKVEINEGYISSTVNYPIDILKGESSYQLEKLNFICKYHNRY